MSDERMPSYYAIIPANVRYDERLSSAEKLLYGEITALTSKTGKCWATNKYFSDLYHVAPQTISRWLSNLKKYGYIDVAYTYKKGTPVIDSRAISIADSSFHDRSQFCERVVNKNENDTVNKNVKDNNTSNEYYKIIIDYLNKKAGTKYKHSTKTTKKLIDDRLDEGFTVDDFKTVIDKKSNEWLENEKMRPYLRPATLFGDKFERYLNQQTQNNNSYQVINESETEISKKEDDFFFSKDIKFNKKKSRIGLEDIIKGGANG